jgi:hypothetical protein
MTPIFIIPWPSCMVPLKMNVILGVMDHCFISFEIAQIEIKLKWKKKGWKYTWPQAQWQCNPMVTLQDLVSTSISCYYIQLVKYTSISKLLKFGRKKTRITIYQLCSTKVVNIKKDHITMQGWTLYFHNFKLQPSLIYDEAYFWHNDETHKLFLALSHCVYS